MARSKSSGRWLREHEEDRFVQQARRENYRSRAVYKLIEIDAREQLLTEGITVVELGAAPGGWTQYIERKLGHRGRIIATDILPMDALGDVEFIQGDFTEQSVLDALIAAMGDARADLVLSDMAPNMSGVAVSDQARAMYLAELALDTASRLLKPGGHFVTKMFQGRGFEEICTEMRQTFEKLHIRKPEASRSRSSEIYAVARNLFL
ncbi:MAG: 23S rRNA (uridine(2552)-2'-O)-methyltransferase RlmE [Gammaproteobacteria bacterium]|nr:23S rRNA (uridine(2552)-2'-O)-methyltransferase RlmE [Gammaproteobacteria bacterium]